mgnify:CR=1 FL=1
MTNENKTHLRLNLLLSLIPIGVAIGFILGVLNVPQIESNQTNVLLASIGTATLYGVAVYFGRSVTTTMWMGYAHMASAIALLTVGVVNSLYIIIFASTLAVTFRDQLNHSTTNTSINLQEILSWISISGITILADYIVYTVIFNQQLPFNLLTIQSLFLVVVTLSLGNVVSISVGSIIARQPIAKLFQQTITNHPLQFELILLLISASVAIIYYEVNILTFGVIISIAIAYIIYESRNSQVKHDSFVRMQQLSTFNRFAQAVSSNLELDDVLENIYNEVNEIVNATLIFVALYNDEDEQIDYPIVRKNGEPITWHNRRLKNGFTDYVIRNKKPIHIVKSDKSRLKALGINVELIESESFVGIPMMIGEKIIGAVGIINHYTEDVLGTIELSVLQSVINQASLALRNATLYDRTTKLATNLSLINKSVQDVMFNLDYQESLRAVTQVAKTVTHADQVAIFLVSLQDKPTIRLGQSIGISSDFKAKLETASLDWFSNNGDSNRIVYDVKECDVTIIKELASIGDFQAVAEIPMRSGNMVVGYLVIYHQHPHNYHSFEIDLLEMLASQITVALDNTDLLQALELYASEQAELVHLSNISSSSLELKSYNRCLTVTS